MQHLQETPESDIVDLGSVTTETKGGAINLFGDGDNGYRASPVITDE